MSGVKETLRGAGSVRVISLPTPDGIAAASLFAATLRHLGNPCTLSFSIEEPLLAGTILLGHRHPSAPTLDSEASHALSAYLLCKELWPGVARHAHLALIGAMDRELPPPKDVLLDAIDSGTVEVRKGISLFGYQTRSVRNVLSDHLRNGEALLQELDIEGTAPLHTLKEAELGRLAKGLCRMLQADSLIEEQHLLSNEQDPLIKDARDFGRMLSACCRLGQPGLGIGICLGDEEMKKKGMDCLLDYQKELHRSREWVKSAEHVVRHPKYLIINARHSLRPEFCEPLAASLLDTADTVICMAREEGEKTRLAWTSRGGQEELRQLFAQYGSVIGTGQEKEFMEQAEAVLAQMHLEERLE